MKKKGTADSNGRGSETRIIDVRYLTPKNKALYEAGKKLLIDSINAGRDFCKTMITVSIGAIPVYLALLEFFLGKDKNGTLWINGITYLVPPALFLIATAVFSYCYFPRVRRVSLDLPEEIENYINYVITTRRWLAVCASLLFLVGILIGIMLILGFKLFV